MNEDAYMLWQDQDFVIAQCRDCAVPGYLIVSAVQATTRLGELDLRLAARLGVVLTLAAAAVEAIINPLKLYCAQFGEATQQLHFHVFPRTPELTQAYLAVYPKQHDLVHGPVLLDWARSYYRDARLGEKSWALIGQIRNRLQIADV